MDSDINIPLLEGGGPEEIAAEPLVGQRIVIDPVTRIEGHLRIETTMQDGRVTDAWSAGTMFRGLEIILKGRDPRDAWVFAQRICGVCTTVHAIASVRAVENALGITIPDNARILRNLIEGAQFVQDHVMHFYHLHALDWVDVVSALSADATATSTLAQSISDWPNSSPEYFAQVKARVQTLVSSGQLGLFANGYWGHPAYRLSPEANLMAVAHYLEALEWQREYIKIHALLGGKNPHPQTYLVGGMATALDPTNPAALNLTKIEQLRQLNALGLDFVNRVYIPDLVYIAGQYADWVQWGGGFGNFLSYGDWPRNTSGLPGALWMPRGILLRDTPGRVQRLDQARIKESIARSWYAYAQGDKAALHPYNGETAPNYTGPQPPYDYLSLAGKYSWLKAPRYAGLPMEVGPLARVMVAYYAGHARIRQLTDWVLGTLGAGPEALVSTLGRVAARGIETVAIAEKMADWLGELAGNIQNGNLTIHEGSRWDPSTWPADVQGWGTTEAPRGGLGHWVRIQNGLISQYQAVVPTTWNGSPRDATGRRGPWEKALIGTPVADPARPLEVLRVIHSFDPCMACAVHVLDAQRRELVQTTVEMY
jgi:Ni,Fe-hydrogenase I large subunit